MSIAGGDPLVYPQIVDLVKMIKEMGWKPIVNTNGLALDETFLNGTADPSSLKWLLANRVVLNGNILGYFSPKFMELIQTVTHLLSGTYLAYAEPKSIARGKMAAFFGGLADRKMRSIFFKLLGHTIRNPTTILTPAYIQSLMIIQPVNFESDGRQDMCDCCPDITVHEGKLVWSCRLEELNKYGAFVQTVPKKQARLT